jgi:shikimate dehydrogenase
MHAAALRHAGIAARYEALDVPPGFLPQVLGALRAEGAAGNVTIPHKAAVAALCDDRTPVASRVGAVNTFWVDGDRLVGDNTDVGGFDAAVRHAFGPPDAAWTVCVLGAGGSAAAVLAAVERWGAHAWIVARTPERGEALARRYRTHARVAPRAADAVRGADLVVNCSPVGLHDDTHPAPIDLLAPSARVFDLVYRRGGTAWVRAARARGLAADDGLRMLVEQGALSFERWFGIAPDRRVMLDAASR